MVHTSESALRVGSVLHVAQGPVQAAGLIIKEEGILGLWAGAAPTVMRNGTNQMCLFWAKNNFDSLFFGKHEGDGRTLQPWQSMVSGFSAACLGPVATGPFDVIKVRPVAPPCISRTVSIPSCMGAAVIVKTCMQQVCQCDRS
jgi:solute carrier family 25 citrate transporter 1